MILPSPSETALSPTDSYPTLAPNPECGVSFSEAHLTLRTTAPGGSIAVFLAPAPDLFLYEVSISETEVSVWKTSVNGARILRLARNNNLPKEACLALSQPGSRLFLTWVRGWITLGMDVPGLEDDEVNLVKVAAADEYMGDSNYTPL